MPTRRMYTAAFKAQVVLEVLSGTKSQSQVSREHRLQPYLITPWKRQFLENAASVFEKQSPNDAMATRIADLAGVRSQDAGAGDRRKCVQHLEPTPRRELAHELAEAYPVTTVCEMLGMARSSYYYESEGRDDGELRQAVEELAGQWPKTAIAVSRPNCVGLGG